jgi:8-oxo-dGTP pyrophosphatase MutT (NUDIX family)
VPAPAQGGVPVRDASTVLLLRDEPSSDGGTTRLEIFMVRRRDQSGFVGGHHVFPGGIVDPDDRDPEWPRWCTGPSDPFAVAAIRELFEESGVLLAVDGSGARPAVAAGELAPLARAVHAGKQRLIDACRERSWALDTASLAPWSRWITPEGQPRRYDTNFYAARAPEDQEAIHDAVELTEGSWDTPAIFLERRAVGELQMILPTVATLRSLTGHADVASVLAASPGPGPLEPVRPEMRTNEFGAATVLLDGEIVWVEPARGRG